MFNWLKDKYTRFKRWILGLFLIPVAIVAIGQSVPEPVTVYEFGSCSQYQNGTIFLLKSKSADSLEGYQAGDIIEIRDDFKRFGERDCFGKAEKEEYLITYLDRKLTEEEKKNYTATEHASYTPRHAEDIRPFGDVVKKRTYGVRFDEILTPSERVTVDEGNGKGTGEVKEITDTLIEAKGTRLSVVETPLWVATITETKNNFRKIGRLIIPPTYAQSTVVKRIDPDNGTCDGAAADYTSMNSWEAQNLNLTSGGAGLDQVQDARFCSTGGTADTTATTLAGWSTDATHYIKMSVPTASLHDGKWNTAKYRLSVANSIALEIGEDFVRFEGLQIEVNAANANSQITLYLATIAASNDLRIDNCVIRTHGNASFSSVGIAFSDASSIMRIENTVVHHRNEGSGNGGDRTVDMSGTTGFIYNSTFYGGSSSLRHFTPAVTRAVNLAIASSSSGLNISSGTFSCDRCASHDSTADNFGGTGHLINQALTDYDWTDDFNTNFHIADTSTLEDAALDLSATTTIPFSDDIDGETRSGTWDIGADEIVAAGGGDPAPNFVPDGFIDWDM